MPAKTTAKKTARKTATPKTRRKVAGKHWVFVTHGKSGPMGIGGTRTHSDFTGTKAEALSISKARAKSRKALVEVYEVSADGYEILHGQWRGHDREPGRPFPEWSRE